MSISIHDFFKQIPLEHPIKFDLSVEQICVMVPVGSNGSLILEKLLLSTNSIKENLVIFQYREDEDIKKYFSIVSKSEFSKKKFVIISPNYLCPLELDANSQLIVTNQYTPDFLNLGYQRHISDKKLLADDIMSLHYSLGEVKRNLNDTEVFLRDKKTIHLNIGSCKRSEIPKNQHSRICGLFAEDFCQIAKFSGASIENSIINIFGFNDSNISISEIDLICESIWYILEGIDANFIEDPKQDSMTEIIVQLEGGTDLTFYKSNKTNRYWVDLNNEQKPIPCTENEFLKARQNEISDRLLNL